jgi:tRNA (cmo5U34)-methyltransferase
MFFMRMDRVKTHFEDEAEEFDTIIKKLIPNYSEMVDILVSSIPYAKESKFSMIDLGCGTGTISKSVKDVFPNVTSTCVDIAEKMLLIAKEKINGKVVPIQADFNRFEFPDKYDLVVSSLALHHLENDADKLCFYKKIYSAMNDGGIFINIDVVLGSDDSLQKLYMEKWKGFMSKNVSAEEIEDKWLKNYYMEDRPAKLITHLEMLKECGFPCVDVLYKYFNYAVYTGKK